MSQIITNNFKLYNAATFVDSTSGSDTLYLSVGRPQRWVNENSPPTPTNTQYQDVVYSSENIALKRIVSADVKQVVKRYDWSPGVVYSQYDNANNNLFNSNFYVLTLPEYNVYKCISNNNGATSTDKPSGKSTSIVTTADGYRWKYLYSLTDTDLLKFLTNDFMAVNNNADVTATAIPGTIDSIVVDNPGTVYSNVSLNTSSISGSLKGNGTGAALGNINYSGGGVTSVELLDSGSGYTYANVIIDSTYAPNAVTRPIISPLRGHGYDNKEELGGYYVMINTRLDYAEGGGDFPIVNDYRRIAVIKNPVSNTTNSVATELTMDATYTLKLTSVTGTFVLDEIITGSNSSITNTKGFIISANANVITGNTIIKYIVPIDYKLNQNAGFLLGETITGNTSLATGIVSSIILPEVKENTGKVLYVENRKKITRSSDQAENIHIVIEF